MRPFCTACAAQAGTDHKLHIILNKADKFERIHDFARAYGALCWNLSKIIPRKDLPRIYTMCVPQRARGSAEEEDDAAPRPTFLQSGLEDLHRTRDEVLKEVRRAPSRRVDNAITRLQDAAALLLMHAEVCDAARKAALYKKLQLYGTTALAASAVAASSGALFFANVFGAGPPIALAVLGAAATSGLHYLNHNATRKAIDDINAAQGLDALYRQTYSKDVVRGDEESAALWRRVRDHLTHKLDALGGATAVPAPGRANTNTLRRILENDVPQLRRDSAPAAFGTSITRRIFGTPPDSPPP